MKTRREFLNVLFDGRPVRVPSALPGMRDRTVTIGSGIFRTPAGIAARVPDPGLMLAVWLIGGAISLCGALSVAELAAAFPQTGVRTSS